MMHLIAGKYEVLSQIGKGGMGVVYQVRHRTLETVLALKVLPAELAEDADIVRRFHQEARVMAQLRHPHIVHVQDVDRDGDTHYFVMEYVEGKSLSQYLRERGVLPLLEVLAITKQIAQALDYAHTHQPPVIHRDIKPANILIEESSGRVVVTDFGIAKVLGEHTSKLTRVGSSLGTPRYMAPEQWIGSKVDGRTDLYALGILIYEMLTGQPPFTTEDGPQALMYAHLHTPPPPLPASIPVGIHAQVERLLAKTPQERPADALSVCRALEEAVAEEKTRSTIILGEAPKNRVEEASRQSEALQLQKEQEEATLLRSSGERRCWWSWIPRLQLKVWISLSVTFVVLLSFAYLWHDWVQIPSRRGNPPGYIPRNAISPSFEVPKEYERAFEDLQAGQLDTALAAFQGVATTSGNALGLGYDGLAAIYFEKGLVAEAKEAIQKSLAASPANTMALLVQGDISFAMGEGEKAASEYLQATKAETQWGWQKALAYNALGVSYSLEGMTAKAQSCFNEALVSDRGSFAAYSNLGYLFWQEGNLQAAQRSFQEARNLQRDDELSQTFLEMTSTKGSEDSTKGVGEKLLLVPFALGGGNLRRLGEGDALVRKLARHLPPSVQHEIVGQDFLGKGRQGELLRDPAALVALAKEKGAAYIVWGELQSFATKLIIHGQVVEVKTGTGKRVSYVQEGMNGRLEAAAQVLAEQVSSAIFQEQG